MCRRMTRDEVLALGGDTDLHRRLGEALVELDRAYHEVERRSQFELQRLSALLEEAPVLFHVLEGPELRLVMMNRRSRETFGERASLGVALGDLVPPTNSTLLAAQRVHATGVPESFEV